MNKTQDYYNGVNKKLFELIPRKAIKVLEIGCANGLLGEMYKSFFPETEWTGIDISESAIERSKNRLDFAVKIDLNKDSIQSFIKSKKFDVVVMGDVLEHLTDPERILQELYELTTEEAKIVCCLPNATHYSICHRLIAGDFSYDEMGLLDKTHVRLYSYSSAFKLFLDHGWLPNMRDQNRTFVDESNPFIAHICAAAESIGVPKKTFLDNTGLYQMFIECQKISFNKEQNAKIENTISVIVPTNRRWELDLNIKRSPGLQEIGAEVIYISGAKNAAEAFEAGKSKAKNNWILFAHQDVYLPKNSGYLIIENIKKIEDRAAKDVLIGFAGLSLTEDNKPKRSGLVIDRRNLFNYPETSNAISIDELGIILHKETNLNIDPTLGWHTWATDLCLQSLIRKKKNSNIILRVPVFHNSLNDNFVSKSYKESAKILLNKYPNIQQIPTLIGIIKK